MRTNRRAATSSTRRERNLRDNQSSAQQEAFPSRGQSASACLHHRPGIGISRVNGRRHSKQHTGEQGYAKREREHAQYG